MPVHAQRSSDGSFCAVYHLQHDTAEDPALYVAVADSYVAAYVKS